jgi:enamine deaminase RidA (YjgF/YER057c/UK114 family)
MQIYRHNIRRDDDILSDQSRFLTGDYFGEHLPASTLVEVSALVDSRMKVEIECQAVLPDAS